jgi:hypothetical protein
MTAVILEFPSRAAPVPLDELDAWCDEVDDLGPFPNPIQVDLLLKRCPDPTHEVAVWLAAQTRASATG